MTLEEIVEKFAHALDNCDHIDRQPSDTDLTRLQEVVVPLLLQIPYDETGAVQNLIGHIWPRGCLRRPVWRGVPWAHKSRGLQF